MKITLGIILLVMVVVLSCTKSSTPTLYVPVASDATPNVTLEGLQLGRSLYIDNCGKCHDLYSPDDFSQTTWLNILSRMAPKTGMNSSQVSLVTKYVNRGH